MSEKRRRELMLGSQIAPRSAEEFKIFIREQAKLGPYTLSVESLDEQIKLAIVPDVFPPPVNIVLPEYLQTHTRIKTMADIGTGSGVEAIFAAKFGVEYIDAVDINDASIACAKQNAEMNQVSEHIQFFVSDLFERIPKGTKYDLIYANLPFVLSEQIEDAIDVALYDPGFRIHERFFRQAKEYLAKNGSLLMPQADVQRDISTNKQNSPDIFHLFEKMSVEEGYSWKLLRERPFREQNIWRLYECFLPT